MQGDTVQSPIVRDEGRERRAKRILTKLPYAPAPAISKLRGIACPDTRRKIALLIAHNWARQDINAAWNAIACSPLNASEKQFIFNEVWG